jgi:hypothetical protein
MTNVVQRFQEGYDWKPWDPYVTTEEARVRRGIHHAFGLHHRSRNGSWSFGYDYVCVCGMGIGEWSEEKREKVAKQIYDNPNTYPKEIIDTL